MSRLVHVILSLLAFLPGVVHAEDIVVGLNDKIRVRVGTPLVARGPAGDIADNWFTEIGLPDGRFRGFTAGGVSWAIDGHHPYEMSGPGTAVLKAGPPGSSATCGQWIQHVELVGKTLYGWVHDETACNYAKGQTHASMTIATSSDDGLTWKMEGPIIVGTDPPVAGKFTGDSCPSVVKGEDGYYYAYCLRNGGQSWNGGYTFIARAPASNLAASQWKKFFNGAWSEPGVGGKSSPIDGLGVAYWTTTHQTISLNWARGGIGLQVSADRLHFTPLFPQPLMLVTGGDWGRHDGLELISYPDLIDAKTGLNQLGDHWLLAYMYLSPGEGFAKRYLIFRPVDISWSRAPGEPVVGEMLTHWYDAIHHDHWVTIAPVPGNYTSYRLVAQLGYMMTTADPAEPTVELEECISKAAGPLDRILTRKGVCEQSGYKPLRTAGFVYSTAQPNTRPLYRCYSESEHSHFVSNDENCNKVGRREELLGYDLNR
ncbi:hypothetical protein [Bradyrhizobium ganzhouense]|uniref:hypothetical protein n=1 Tax=Bradyrhizobium ganzhouense TaxID=1179767 RepID=UPI003CF81B25